LNIDELLLNPAIPKLSVAKAIAVAEKNKLLNLESLLKKNIVGQNDAIAAVSRAVRRAKAGFADDCRPVAVFLFLGPTGTGKTELCKALAEVLYGDRKKLLKLDMSEFMTKWDSSKLTGAAPGFTGYESGGVLTNMVRDNPTAVLCIDEIEKAAPEIFNVFLQVFDEAHLTSSQGESISFKDILIVMTSNIASEVIIGSDKFIGFSKNNISYELDVKSKVNSALKKTFKPEFLNRIDEIITFNQLNENHVEQICMIMLDKVKSRAQKLDIKINFDSNVVKELIKLGFDKEYGARPLRRVITAKIEDYLADSVISGELKSDDEINIVYNKNGFVMEKKKSIKIKKGYGESNGN
jgi:ATP-dependent Clp protease ATP-binding subunit ClpC